MPLVPALLVAAALLWAQPAQGDPLRPRPQQVTIPHHSPGQVPVLGPGHAPVTIDFFLNLNARRSLRLHRDLLTLAERHPRRLRIVYRLVVSSSHTMLAEAGMEAFAQGRFLPFLDELLGFVSAHERLVPQREPELRAACERAGVDFERVRAAWADGRHLPVLDDNELYRRRRRAPSAPSVLFNGTPPGVSASSLDIHRLETSYDTAHAAARVLLEDGVPLEHIYALSLRELDLATPPEPLTAGPVDGAGPDRGDYLDAAPLVRAQPGGHTIGPDHAPVTLRLYCNFLSTNCTLLKRTLDQLRAHYPAELRLVYYPMFPEDRTAEQEQALVTMHHAALCADEQSAFWRFYDNAYRGYLHRRQRTLPPGEQIAEIIANLELDPDRFRACMDSPARAAQVMEQVRAGHRAGVTHSPSLVIGGRLYAGGKPLSELRSLVDQELLPGLFERFAPILDHEPGPGLLPSYRKH